jgi:hypothetical protein
MDKNTQKFLTVLSLILVAVSSITFPLSTARKTEIVPQNLPSTGQGKLSVIEYRPDGTARLFTVNMSEMQARMFEQELKAAASIKEQISLYKKYNIGGDDSFETFQYLTKQQTNDEDGLTGNNSSSTSPATPLFSFSFLSFVSGFGVGYYLPSLLFLPIGTSLLTSFLNSQHPWIISVDLVDYVLGDLEFQIKGPSHSFSGDFIGLIKIVGFIGFAFAYGGRHGYLAQGFTGFAISVRAIGRIYYY